MRSKSISDLCVAWAASAACTLALAALLGSTSARADLWAYIDAQGRAHFASERVDERYGLFLRAAPRPAQPVVAEPTASAASVDESEVAAQGAPAAAAPAEQAQRARLLRFFDTSPAVRRTDALVRAAAVQHRIDVELLQALIAAESGFDAQAVSPKGAVGLMQVMPATAQRYGVQAQGRVPVAQQLTDPQTNIHAGTRYLRDLMNRFGGRLELALAAYNAGEGAVERYGNTIPPFAETQNYVRTVMQIYRALRPEAPPRTARATHGMPAALPPASSAPSAPSAPPATREATPPGGAVGRRNMIEPLTAVR